MLNHPILVSLTTDDQGWPFIQFEPADPALDSVAAFLQSDVDISLPGCDLLLGELDAILQGRQPGWTWNGNSYLVEIQRERSTITDKYGDPRSGRVSVDTDVLLLIIRVWKRFVSDLPRQRELAATQQALLHPDVPAEQAH